MNVREQSESPAQATALVLQSGEFGELERRATVVLARTGDSSYFVSLASHGIGTHGTCRSRTRSERLNGFALAYFDFFPA